MRRDWMLVPWLLAAWTCSAGELDCIRLDVIDDETGAVVVGIEDLAFDRRRRMLYLSGYDRRAVDAALVTAGTVPGGAIHSVPFARLLDLIGAAGGSRGSVAIRSRGLPVVDQAGTAVGLRPHGLAVESNPGGTRLHLVNRRVVGAGMSRTLRGELHSYDVADDGLHRVAPVVADALLCNANDVALGPAGVRWVTRDRVACGGWARWFETLWGEATGGIVRVSPRGTAAIVADGIAFANGIAVSAAGVVAVTATRGRRVHLFEIDPEARLQPLTPGGVPLPLAPDNASFDDAGRLWIAGFDSLISYALFRNGWRRALSSSFVRIAGGRQPSAPLRFDHDGTALSAATTVLAIDGLLIAGSAYDAGLLVCRHPVHREPSS